MILFCPCDRHNLGDLLFPHLAARLLGLRRPQVAGLVGRDMRPWGGHLVQPVTRWAGSGKALVHAGGEILTCTAEAAAVMTLPPDEAARLLARRDPRIDEDRVRALLGTERRAPYVAPRSATGGPLVFASVGGVALDAADPPLRAEVLQALGEADYVAVRDSRTRRILKAGGIDARLAPDPAVLTAELFAEEVRAHGTQGEPAAMRQRFPGGYLAAQVSGDFGDDATLALLAGQLRQAASANALGIVLFRAGAAPWHDDLDVLDRLADRLPAAWISVARSLHIWDICALLAQSAAYCGSSLHGRIVAGAFERPRLSLARPGTIQLKQAAWCATWEPELPGVVEAGEAAEAIERALGVPSERLARSAAQQAGAARRAFDEWRAFARP